MRFRIAERDGQAYIFDGETTYYGPFYVSAVGRVWADVYSRGEILSNQCTRWHHSALKPWGVREYIEHIDMDLDLSPMLKENPLAPIAVRWVRIQRDDTLKSFALACGVTEQTVVNWEQGRYPCSGSPAILIRDFLDPLRSR